MSNAVRNYLADEAGATAIEYGLIAGLMAVAAIASFMVLGDALINLMGFGPGGASEVIDASSEAIRERDGG